MFTIHATAKLLTTLEVRPESPSEPTTRLGNWYAGPSGVPGGLIVCVSEKTFLPVAIGLMPATLLPAALADAVSFLLLDLGFPAALVEEERRAMAECRWAKTVSPTVRGVLNEQTSWAESLVEAGHRSMRAFNLELSENIVKLQFPVELAREAFGIASRRTPPPAPRAEAPAKAPPVAGEAPLELAVLAVKHSSLRCRVPGSPEEVTLRTAVRDEVPGELITVAPNRRWTNAGHPYLSGKILRSHLDVARLELVPLKLHPQGTWTPNEAYWGEDDDPRPAWATEIIKRGPRPAFEMEQVLPGADPDDWESDPIVESAELKREGRFADARAILNELLAQDLRCLDAHGHLGNIAFEHHPAVALRHYRVGTTIGELSLGADFNGVLPWGMIDNRPFLRCLHGVGLCLWRLGKRGEATAIFRRMLWLNPGDNQGARINLAQLERGEEWSEDE